MISRRQLLKASLTVCGSATCGGLGLSAFTHNARADGPIAIKGAGYDLWFVGSQRETIMNGRLAAVLDLNTLASRQHLYGIGPIEQLRGEVTIADSRPALARVASDGTVKVTQSFETGVPFLSGPRFLGGVKFQFRRTSVRSRSLSTSFQKRPPLPVWMPKSRCPSWSTDARISSNFMS
jgi:hypothetical protein